MTTTQLAVKPNSSAASALRPLVFDLGVPLGSYYLLRKLGVDLVPALALSSVVPAFRAIVGLVRELADAVRKVLAGQQVIDPVLAAAALSAGPNPLTLRERDVLSAAADGATIADIAQRLYLSESTVRNYLSAAIGKTGSRNRIEAVQSARANGWL
jgi:two-component system, NarL family, response regulator DesR